ncbi:MAG: C25 family cysteine peptidase [Planctomycetaceae bacterium]
MKFLLRVCLNSRQPHPAILLGWTLCLTGCSPHVSVDSGTAQVERRQQVASLERPSTTPTRPVAQATPATPAPAAAPASAATWTPAATSVQPPPLPDLPPQTEPSSVTQSDSTLVVAVCPQPFQAALEPWVQRRQREGLDVAVIDSQPTAEALKASLRSTDTQRCSYVLLVGDSQLSPGGEPSDPQRYVPTLYRPAEVTAAYQQTPQLPGDFAYGDFDEDGVAQAAVGRLPVKTASQLTSLIHRIIAYEDSTDFGRWRSRVDLVAGIGGFGPVIDGAIEMVAGGIITGSLPGSVRTRITHASPTSAFHPGADNFTSTVLGNYRDGARFWVYAGHGWVNELDRVPPNQYGRPVLSLSDLPQLERPHASSPIALMLACYTGAFDASEDCLAERLLLADQGPIAVLAGSRVTMPYGNAAAAVGLIHAVYERQTLRLGDAWRHALQEMHTASHTDPALQGRRMMIDGIATVLGGGSNIDAERREHMQLYNWFGDPTLRTSPGLEVDLDEGEDAVVGQNWSVAGSSPISGMLTVEIHRRLGSPPISSKPESSDYEAANDTVIAARTFAVAPGRWTCEFPAVGATAGGERVSSSVPLIVKADVVGDSGFASGSRTAWLRAPRESAKPPQLSMPAEPGEANLGSIR